MLTLVVSKNDFYDDSTSTFISVPEQTIHLQHSLISISRWESKWNKPYLSKTPRTNLETLDYVTCMTTGKDISLETAMSLSLEQLKQINDYIAASMTATTFPKDTRPPNNRIITSEVIYGEMISYNIPFECEKWHFNRLMVLIRHCASLNQKPKPMGAKALMSRNAELNNARRAQYNTRG